MTKLIHEPGEISLFRAVYDLAKRDLLTEARWLSPSKHLHNPKVTRSQRQTRREIIASAMSARAFLKFWDILN